MKENNFLFVLLLFFFTCFKLNAEIIVLSKCDHKEDKFLKNEYIFNLNELTMTRNYVYTEKTYKKYRITDLSVKKSNSYVRNIYEEEEKILTLNHLKKDHKLYFQFFFWFQKFFSLNLYQVSFDYLT